MDLFVRNLKTPSRTVQYPINEIDKLWSVLGRQTTRDVVFVTGNKNKVLELEKHIDPSLIKLTPMDLDVPEIQDSDVFNIVEKKCLAAYELVNGSSSPGTKSVLVEDTSLHFRALNGMPGPYIKWFVKAVGSSGLHKMLAGFDDKSAEAVCIYALMDDPASITLCRGSVKGNISAPRGSSWGWDPVFEEATTGQTFGEMSADMKQKLSHRANAIVVLNKVLSMVRK